MNKPGNRITMILLGSAIYWAGYSGMFTHQQSSPFSLIYVVLIVSGLMLASWNSFNLFRGN